MRKIFFLTLLVLPMVLFGQTEFGSYNWNTYPSDNKSDTIKCVNGAAVTLNSTGVQPQQISASTNEEHQHLAPKIRI